MSATTTGHVSWSLEDNEYYDETETDTSTTSDSEWDTDTEWDTDCETDTGSDTGSDTDLSDEFDDYVDAGTVGIRFLRLMTELRRRAYGTERN